MTVQFHGQLDLRSNLPDAVIDCQGIVAAERIAIPEPCGAVVTGGRSELHEVVEVGARGVLGVHPDRVGGALVLHELQGLHHHVDEVLTAEPAPEFSLHHLVAGRKRDVEVLELRTVLHRLLELGRPAGAPPLEAHGRNDALRGEGQVGVEVIDLVIGEREAELALPDPELIEQEVDDGLLELGQTQSRGLNPVTVGDVDEADEGGGFVGHSVLSLDFCDTRKRVPNLQRTRCRD